MVTATWQAVAVAHLCESKRLGRTWADAEAEAYVAVRRRIPGKDSEAPSLFEQANTQEGFFWRVARNAYLDVRSPPVGEKGANGNGPGLRWWTTDMLGETVPERMTTGLAA